MKDFTKVSDEELVTMRREATAAGNSLLKLQIRKESDRRDIIKIKANNSAGRNV
jgi:hypothetical protein